MSIPKSIFSVLLFLVFTAISMDVKSQLLDSLGLANAREFKSLKEAMRNPDEVYKLTLKRKKLRNFPSEIFLFKNLNELNLTNNHINFIPPEINTLKYLQNLYLGKNNITALPVELTTLEHLKILSLNRNDIELLPPEIGNLYSLRTLDLWGTAIVSFPYEISRLKHLLELVDLRVIYMNRSQQDEIKQLLPSTIILFSKPCNCI
ncbi:MAG: hypothetical protein PHT69_08180 [Bacteroidales bacterium]|nr:hypothetical protein [Bacteroidales bacterium]